MFRFLKLEVVHWDYWERFSLPLESDVITIVGPNGSGKTTLLDALRTLLCIDCSAGRDYKRYVRRNEKPFSWIRAVVVNERQGSGFRPFFPLLSDKVTLACRIRKKGGDWQRDYLLADGDVGIEKLDENGSWIGVRDHRLRLEQAGLSPAIRRVLALEQGDTDKLCEYTPRQLLELVFSVFGDQEVLDNYQKAKNEQMMTGRELDNLEEELSRLGTRLLEAEANVNSFREWEDINKELDTLTQEILPRAELADLHDRITSSRPPLRKKRIGLKVRRQNLGAHQEKVNSLLFSLDSSRKKEEGLELAVEDAQKTLDSHRDAHRDAEKILGEKRTLEERCKQQQQGFDASVLAAEHREGLQRRAANDFDLERVRERLSTLRARIEALKAGKRILPQFVLDFRRALGAAKISHCLLTDIVEVVEPEWQNAMEGVLGPFAHIVVLREPNDRRRAWELGEELRYRHFVVAERSHLPEIVAGSMLEVARFLEDPPAWVPELLNRIRRVESVKEGSRLPREISWVTREGYHREYRGARYIGVEAGKYRFGEAAIRNMVIESEKELAELKGRERILTEENGALSRRIEDIQALLAGIDASKALTARSAEFAQAEKELPTLTKQIKDAELFLSECKGILKKAQQETNKSEAERRFLELEIERAGEELLREDTEFSHQKKQQIERITEYRRRSRPMPPRWYSRQAREELRAEYGSAEAVKKEIERLKKRLIQGSWVTDPQVVEIRDKFKGEHSHLQETIKTRRVHHLRHVKATDEARESYINVLRATVRRYGHNVRSLGQLAGIDVAVEPPHLVNEDLALAQAGLNVKFDFDRKGMIGLNDGEASGGQQVMKSLILLVGLLMDETRTGGFVFIDEPFAHLDVFNIDRVGAFLEATRAQYVLTTPNTHNVNVFKKSDLTLITQKKRPPREMGATGGIYPAGEGRQVKPETNEKWSSPDGDGIITCTLDVGAVSTLRGRRRRRGTTLRITDIALWPPSWRELLKEWLKQGGPRRKWEGLLKCAGGQRVTEALQLLDSMLMAGLIEIEERRSQNRWHPLWVEFLEEETIRESVGLPNREKLRRLAEEQLKVPFQNPILEELEASLPGMPPDRAIRRHKILLALDHWISDQRNGTRRDFAFFALGDTKGLSSAEWNWLESSLILEDIGIFRHTPAIWLRAPLTLICGMGTLDLRGVPDCIALTPETINDVNRIEGKVGQWLLLENRTVFERTARKSSADGVIWTPGFAPGWWKDGVARILDLCPAPALVACDPDPAGIEIALDVGQLFTERSLPWKPWYMDVSTLSALKRKKSLSEDDRDRLKRLLSRPLPESLKDLSLWMIENGQKGEQEGIHL